MAHKISFHLDPNQINLDHIFDQYVAGLGAELSPEQKEAIKPVFFSGASSVLSIFDQLTANVLATEMAMYENLGEFEEPSLEAQAEVDAQCDQLQQIMTVLMNNVCDFLEMPNDSQILNDEMQSVDVKLVTPETEEVTKDFDLANWNPTKGAN